MVFTREEINPLVTALVNPYLLGVLAHVNETLQDVYGRKGLDEKQKVIRGLKNLISTLGSAIGRVSPQVCFCLYQELIGRYLCAR